MQKSVAQTLLYGGALVGLTAAFAELQQAKTWAEVLTPAHVFGALSALVMAIGAYLHPAPGVKSK